jgi:typhoid toxin secretion A
MSRLINTKYKETKAKGNDMSLKTKLITNLLLIEGGYVDDPSDSGGETNFGITEYVARKYGYEGAMKDLPRETAVEIYDARYIEKLRIEEISIIAGDKIAEELFDTGVNMGVARAGEFLQRGLNVLNNQSKLYPDLLVDGGIGGKTLSALHAFIDKRKEEGKTVLHSMLNSLQGSFYVQLGERRVKDEKFMYGWFKNRIV